ncbi:Ankyrin repeat family protein [Prunus dulcis]|uniref:Ankyrin repeat family protein n=1 Tax=Prunus dulcis TaxID=3755 RepID=A0A4Y1RID1_PRUDU|nr:Ankyrin repeat family protein [Prunus dulcis]
MKRWIQNPNRCADEYLDGIEDFIEFARRHNPGATRIRCPCRRCNNTLFETIENVGFHLVKNGMIETYSIWNLHGEQVDHASSSNAPRVDNVEPIVDPNDQVMGIIQDAFPFASTNINQEGEDDVPTPIDSAEFEQYEKPLCMTAMTAIFFSQLTAKTLRRTNMFQLRHDIVQVLCKFEMIFPPAFFTSMMHVMVHLPEEALLAGPVNYRWMYPIERLLGELKKKCTQQGKARRINYRGLDVETVFNRPQRNNDGGMRNEKLSVFAQSARPFGDPGRGESFSRNDMEVAHWFVLNNCDEIMAYLDEHEQMMKREHPSHLVARKHRELFPQWFLDSVNKLKSSNSPTYSDELYNLAFGPIRAELFSGCNVNGVKFLGAARDDKLCTQNSGVHVPGGGESTDIDFYGKLTTVVQLLYKDRYQVIMFKCRWFDTNPNRAEVLKSTMEYCL